MPKQLPIIFSILFAVVLVSGCSTAKNVTVRGYIDDKTRIDQEVQGKLGNWQNSSDVIAVEHRPTRRIYAMEVTKEPIKKSAEEMIEESKAKAQAQVSEEIQQQPEEIKEVVVEPKQNFNIPNFDDEPSGTTESAVANKSNLLVISGDGTSYTVKKDDTLQKIAKEFYGSYGKWTKIYDANKDLIPDPNRIKPGITIQIPAAE